EYEIVAHRGGTENEQSYSSTPRRVSVRGADVGGIELKVLPLATIAGKVQLEPSQTACAEKRKATLDEVLISVRANTRPSLAGYSSQTITRLGAADDKGEFAVYDLDPNQYFISSRLPNDNWYLKSIVASTTPVSAASAKIATRSSAVSDLARTGVT